MDKPVGRLIWSRIRVSMDHKGFRGGSDGKESAYKAGDLCSIPGLGRSPGEWNSYPTPVFWPGELHGQRSLANYSPWGHKESDTTERLSLSLLYGS